MRVLWSDSHIRRVTLHYLSGILSAPFDIAAIGDLIGDVMFSSSSLQVGLNLEIPETRCLMSLAFY